MRSSLKNMLLRFIATRFGIKRSMGSSLEEELRFMSEGDVSILKGLSRSISLLKAKGEPTLMLLIEFIQIERRKWEKLGVFFN